ncbi:hypothetical protein Ac2012v2_001405 [Leucoagaricus gongylophorus]
MTITPILKASARSAYRNMYRAASCRFSGDELILAVFRQKMRDDAAKAQMLTSTEEYERHTQFANDVAEFLRKNIIQGVKVAEGNRGDDGTWYLPIHDETELGSNESIKNPKVMESSRSAIKREEWTNPI